MANSVLTVSVLQNQCSVLALNEGSLSSSSLERASLTFCDFFAFGRIDTVTSFCTLGAATSFRGANCFWGIVGDPKSKFTLFCWRNVSLSTSSMALTFFETECATTSPAVQATDKQSAMASELHTVTFCHSDDRLDTNSFSRISINLWNGNKGNLLLDKGCENSEHQRSHCMSVILTARFYLHVLQNKRICIGRTNFSTIQELSQLRLKVT